MILVEIGLANGDTKVGGKGVYLLGAGNIGGANINWSPTWMYKLGDYLAIGFDGASEDAANKLGVPRTLELSRIVSMVEKGVLDDEPAPNGQHLTEAGHA